MYIRANIRNYKTSGDLIIAIKYLHLMLVALFIPRLNGKTVSIESIAVLEAWLKLTAIGNTVFPDKSSSSLFIIEQFQFKE